ncbi:Protein of unknown function [Lactobacillus delbrueckii subsp. lactis]|nr:Protein of unknown function [Lactobacillus delbrueckii subsp. lactis]
MKCQMCQQMNNAMLFSAAVITLLQIM